LSSISSRILSVIIVLLFCWTDGRARARAAWEISFRRPRMRKLNLKPHSLTRPAEFSVIRLHRAALDSPLDHPRGCQRVSRKALEERGARRSEALQGRRRAFEIQTQVGRRRSRRSERREQEEVGEEEKKRGREEGEEGEGRRRRENKREDRREEDKREEDKEKKRSREEEKKKEGVE